MLDILWLLLIIYIVILGFYFSKKINYKNYKIKRLIKKINKDNLYISLGTKMGVGTLIGTTMSIFIGGAGSIFWMSIFTLLTSSIVFVESSLGYKYRNKDTRISGIYFYTKNGLKNKKLALLMMTLFISVYSFFFLMIQSNTIASILNINKVILIFVFFFFIILLITNNLTEIKKLINKIVPIMCLIFLLLSLYGVMKNINILPVIIKQIMINSINKKSFITGMIIGIKRSIFLNELLIGTNTMSSGINNKDKDSVANTLILSSYFIIFIISTLLSFLILIYLYNTNYTSHSYMNLLINTFNYHFNNYGNYFLTLLICLLGTSTIISGIFIGNSNIYYLTNNKYLKILFNIFIILFIIGGIILNINVIWKFIDFLMLIIISINGFIIIKLKDDI